MIADDLIELVKMRNEFAKTQGYKNYFEYMIEKVYEIDTNDLQNLIDEVYNSIKEINKKLRLGNEFSA